MRKKYKTVEEFFNEEVPQHIEQKVEHQIKIIELLLILNNLKQNKF